MHYTIQRNGADLLTIRPEGKVSKKIMGEDVVSLTFDLPIYTELKLGDTLTVFGETFTLNRLPQVEKTALRQYRYTCAFESIAYELSKVAFMMLGDDNTLKEPDFALMANANGFLDLLIQNLNRVQSGWQKGMVDSTETRNLTFNKESCSQVLSKVALEFNTEFWVNGKTIHLTKRGPISNLTFEYGKGKGLYQVNRANKDGANVLTRLYAYGAQRNLYPDYRNYSNRLLLPSGTPYLEKNVEEYGVMEHVEIWDDIFPRRESTVTAVGDMYTFYDSAMDFDLNNFLLPGEVAKVTFNSGQLAGYTFEIASYHQSEKKFTFLRNKEEEALEIPNEFLKPAVGDQYVLIDIYMPQTYVDKAEAELQTRALEYLEQNSVPRVMYTVTCDPLHFERSGVYVGLGTFVQVKDEAMGVDLSLRVVGLTRDVSNGYLYTLELSESFTIPQILRQYAQQDKVNKYIAAQEKKVTITIPVFKAEWKTLTNFTYGASAGNVPVQYMKDSHGMVHLRGNLKVSGSMLSVFQPVLSLPEGFRPDTNAYFPTYGGRIYIAASGALTCHQSYNGVCYLDGVSYWAG